MVQQAVHVINMHEIKLQSRMDFVRNPHYVVGDMFAQTGVEIVGTVTLLSRYNNSEARELWKIC
jgi:hypothetical protein